jgi:hypothetical protein
MRAMKVFTFQRLIVLWLVAVTLYPMTSPAPLIYVPGEGWSYVRPGDSEASRWRRPNATEQIQVSRDADQAVIDWLGSLPSGSWINGLSPITAQKLSISLPKATMISAISIKPLKNTKYC